MSQINARRAHVARPGSTVNQKAVLASAYQELGKELSSNNLKTVGNYTLQRPIGEGTYGKVRLGLHRLTNTRVAMKQIPKAHSASLTREIHHHRRLRHPNVMQLYEVIATEQHIWMVSELCAGGELYDYLVENEVLAEPEARRVFGQLCLAVAYIHSNGIVHRDLKLENILLDEQCNIKLGDFGFTREFEGKRLMETFCGTTGYAAPEMLAGKKYSGEEVDIWSLGIILYALLCGALPFDDDDESVMKQKILKGDYELPDCLSDEAHDLIRSILQQDATKRPSLTNILAHPWFSKTMVQLPMSTVQEDDQSGDIVHLDEQVTSTIDPTQQSSSDAGSHPPESVDLSTRSDGGSSDHRSTGTDLTDPTTADSLSRSDYDNAFTSKDMPTTPLASTQTEMGLHRNGSQSTIRRWGSDGSDASLGTNTRASTRSASAFLPTHHELPGDPETSLDDSLGPLYQSAPLSKRGSQSSSRGHHRTPSRTKRRSLSAGGISDHHPPHLGRKPVDYLSQIKTVQPATFSTALEQTLLHQLSSLGFDVGQMVHSVVNDACDTSGAMWWMLVRKAKAAPVTQNLDPSAVSPVAVEEAQQSSHPSPPPPIPEKDPSRRIDELAKSKLSSSRSESSGLFESLSRPPMSDSASIPMSVSLADLRSQSEIRNPSFVSSSTLTSSASVDSSLHAPDLGQRPNAQHRHTTATMTPSKLRHVSDAISGSTTPESARARKREPRAERPRSNSLSMKQFAQNMLGTKDKSTAVAAPEQVVVAGESLPLERAKSPTIFGRRNTVGNQKDSLVGRLSGPSTPNKTSAEASPQRKSQRSLGSINLDTPTHEGGSVHGESLSGTPHGESPSIAAIPIPGKGEVGAISSISQDSFSTTSLTPQGSEKSSAKPKPGSSFIATVRTWLGANEKPNRKNKGGKKATTGPGAAMYEEPAKVASAALGAGTVSRNSSMRRRSALYHQGSGGKRGTPRSPHMSSSSRQSSADRLQQSELYGYAGQGLSRPTNLRRTSAGSITPTATIYGDYPQDYLMTRHSRPSSSQSHAHSMTPIRPDLRGRTGSSGSTSSAFRTGTVGSTYSANSQRRHARRPSEPGTTTVRRHRAYASSTGSPSRRSSLHQSRPSSIRSRASSPEPNASASADGLEAVANGMHPRSTRSARSTPRHSLDVRNPLETSRKAGSSGRASPTQSLKQQQHASVFVAHKSRTPYKAPSAHGSRGASSSGLPQVGTGPWRYSWGRPPPCWAGPVDPPPSNGGMEAAKAEGNRPKLRDVFARSRDEDDWTDEDEEPSYSGGLGQLDSASQYPTSSSHASSSASPFATRNYAALQSNSDGGSVQRFSSRYAGVREMFQPPPPRTALSLSLGNDFAPTLISSTLHSPAGVSNSLANLDSVFATAPETQQQQQQRMTASFHKPTQIIEEDEEDE